MATTTIRISTGARDDLTRLAELEGSSVGHLVERLIAEHNRKKFIEGLAEDFRRLQSDPEAWQFYQNEVALWDSALMDGLEEEPDWEE